MSELCVVKVSGKLLQDTAAVRRLGEQLQDYLKTYRCVLVHGGGVQVSAWQKRLGLPVRFIDGVRVTDLHTMQLVQMVLCGQVNKDLVAALQSLGVAAVGLCGIDAELLSGTAASEQSRVGVDIRCDPALAMYLQSGGYTPVVTTVAVDAQGQALNINADTAASALAQALRAKRLLLLSDVPGILCNGQVVPCLNREQAHRLIKTQVIAGGMIPKVQSALDALAAGVEEVIITDLQGVRLSKGVGTKIVLI